MKWIKASERLPGIHKVVKWRNGAGGNIPLGKNTFLDQYAKVGPNTSWHEWFDESESTLPINEQGQETETIDAIRVQAFKDRQELRLLEEREIVWQNKHNFLNEEVERLNGLIKDLYYKNLRGWGTDGMRESAFNEFKSENNL